MNDYSVEIFNSLRDAAVSEHSGLSVTSSPVKSDEPRLPAAIVTISFPGEDASTADSSGEELWTLTTVDAQAYSGTSEREARAIIKSIDRHLRKLGFRRSNYTIVPNADPSIRRVAAKWRARLGHGGEVAAW